jgi:hypothetical protein
MKVVQRIVLSVLLLATATVAVLSAVALIIKLTCVMQAGRHATDIMDRLPFSWAGLRSRVLCRRPWRYRLLHATGTQCSRAQPPVAISRRAVRVGSEAIVEDGPALHRIVHDGQGSRTNGSFALTRTSRSAA